LFGGVDDLGDFLALPVFEYGLLDVIVICEVLDQTLLVEGPILHELHVACDALELGVAHLEFE